MYEKFLDLTTLAVRWFAVDQHIKQLTSNYRCYFAATDNLDTEVDISNYQLIVNLGCSFAKLPEELAPYLRKFNYHKYLWREDAERFREVFYQSRLIENPDDYLDRVNSSQFVILPELDVAPELVSAGSYMANSCTLIFPASQAETILLYLT